MSLRLIFIVSLLLVTIKVNVVFFVDHQIVKSGGYQRILKMKPKVKHELRLIGFQLKFIS